MSEGTFGNVLFLGVARVDDRVIIAYMSHGASVGLDGVIKVTLPCISGRASNPRAPRPFR